MQPAFVSKVSFVPFLMHSPRASLEKQEIFKVETLVVPFVFIVVCCCISLSYYYYYHYCYYSSFVPDLLSLNEN